MATHVFSGSVVGEQVDEWFTSGFFTLVIEEGPEGPLTGTWSYDGFYEILPDVADVLFIEGALTADGSPGTGWDIQFEGEGTWNPPEFDFALFFSNGGFRVSGTFLVVIDDGTPEDGPIGPATVVWFGVDFFVEGADPDVAGTSAAEHIYGSQDANILTGFGGNDTLHGADGDDTLDGGAGIDTAVLAGAREDFQVSRIEGTWNVIRLVDGETDVLEGVERLLFDDAQWAIDIDGNAGKAYRLYKAAFDRVPDVPGLGFQMHDLDIGHSLLDIAGNFIASPEFQTTYGALSDVQFVTLLYRNVLDREPEPDGLSFHVNRLAIGISRAGILEGFSESPENKANVIGQIQDGMLYIF